METIRNISEAELAALAGDFETAEMKKEEAKASFEKFEAALQAEAEEHARRLRVIDEELERAKTR